MRTCLPNALNKLSRDFNKLSTAVCDCVTVSKIVGLEMLTASVVIESVKLELLLNGDTPRV